MKQPLDPYSFRKKIHRRLAIVAVGASALRNQGVPGMIDTARNYFYHSISLEEFFHALPHKDKFKLFLDKNTDQLRKKFPKGGRSNWGAARKGLNLFFREVVYNKSMSEYFNLPTDLSKFNNRIQYLEVPLDRDVANGIRKHTKEDLPKWKSIRKLKQHESNLYQVEARKIAEKDNTVRVHLDLDYWRPETE